MKVKIGRLSVWMPDPAAPVDDRQEEQVKSLKMRKVRRWKRMQEVSKGPRFDSAFDQITKSHTLHNTH